MRTPITKNDLTAQQIGTQKVAGAQKVAPANVEKAEEQGVAEQIVKFIPAEVIAFYLPAIAAVAGLKAADGSVTPLYTNTLWIVFGAGVIASLFYMYSSSHNDLVKNNIPNPMMRSLAKAIISTFAFAIWALYLGGPFAASVSTSAGTVSPSGQALTTIYGTLLILGFTLANPFIYNSLPFPNSSSDLSIVNKEYTATKSNVLGKVNNVTMRNHTSEEIKLTKASLYWKKNYFQKPLAASKKINQTVPANSELIIKEKLSFMDLKSKMHYLEIETANGCIIRNPPFDSTK